MTEKLKCYVGKKFMDVTTNEIFIFIDFNAETKEVILQHSNDVKQEKCVSIKEFTSLINWFYVK